MPNGGSVRATQSAGAVHVEIGSNDMESPSTIVVLEVNGSAEDVSPIGEVPVNRNVPVLSSNGSPASNANVCDGDPCTYWKSDGSTEKCWLKFDLGRVRTVSRAILLEGYYQGEYANIREAELLVQTAGGWQKVADIRAWGAGTPQANAFDNWPMAVFHQEIRFKPVDTRHVWLKINRTAAAPVIHEFDVYER
jgi:alpha-L-fucosidase